MHIKPIITTTFLAALLFTSCKKELEPQPSAEATTTEAAATEPAAPANQNIEKQFEVQNPNTQTVQAPNPVQTQPQATPTAPGMNPPHGQPNHRCDIAVGAPLNSPKGAMPPAPAASQTAPVQQPVQQGKSTITPVDMASGTVATKPGMNPPHGQPGHRCEIAVGAPLPK